MHSSNPPRVRSFVHRVGSHGRELFAIAAVHVPALGRDHRQRIRSNRSLQNAPNVEPLKMLPTFSQVQGVFKSKLHATATSKDAGAAIQKLVGYCPVMHSYGQAAYRNSVDTYSIPCCVRLGLHIMIT